MVMSYSIVRAMTSARLFSFILLTLETADWEKCWLMRLWNFAFDHQTNFFINKFFMSINRTFVEQMGKFSREFLSILKVLIKLRGFNGTFATNFEFLKKFLNFYLNFSSFPANFLIFFTQIIFLIPKLFNFSLNFSLNLQFHPIFTKLLTVANKISSNSRKKSQTTTDAV